MKSGTDFYDFTAIAIFPGDSSPQPNLLATALIDDSGKHMGAAAIAAAAVASAPRVLDGTDSPAEAAASAIAAAVAVAEEASNNQAEELSPSELASQLLHAKGKIVPDNRQGQGGTEERPLLLKPALPAQSQSKQLHNVSSRTVAAPSRCLKDRLRWSFTGACKVAICPYFCSQSN